uniref:Aminopeptidase n=1 Tax=Ignisphaera aggregans TaxID=334771 RepID=A0A7C5UUX6_9CREN
MFKFKEEVYKASEVALKQCLGVKEGESILVITDEILRGIGLHIWLCARDLNTDAIYIEMLPRKMHGEEPPKPIAEAMKNVDVVVAPTSKSLTHTIAREEATKRGVRVATMPGITEEIFIRTMNVDYSYIQRITDVVGDILDKGNIVRIESDNGTNLTFSIGGRKARRSSGILRNPGDWGNLPGGEAYIAPIEGSANGVAIVDGSMASIGKLINPIKIVFKDGYAIDIEGGDEANKLKQILLQYGQDARNLAEFGIGTNPGAKVSGIVLEDEKVMGTIHIALGNNFGFGGKVKVPIHLDGVILNPTVYIDGNIIMKEGRLLVEV